eukprot:GSChrysophyteH2.ASY1.ANO1.355.1 assembled CDS
MKYAALSLVLAGASLASADIPEPSVHGSVDTNTLTDTPIPSMHRRLPEAVKHGETLLYVCVCVCVCTSLCVSLSLTFALTTQTSHRYDRPNLLFEVRLKSEKKQETLLDIAHYILKGPYAGCTGIVYCMTRSDCEDMAKELQDLGVSADYYHAGMPKGEKQNVQSGWLAGNITVVIATIAYGMGIDKSNVRYVLHTTMAKSLEGYYQEAGRAGRDGEPAECILYVCVCVCVSLSLSL